MKSLKTIVGILLVSVFTVSSTIANNPNPIESKKILRSEIVSLIGDNIPLEINKEVNAEISFVLNKNNEVVIVSVDSHHENLDAFIKSKLNYKKLFTRTAKKGEVYRFNLKVQKSS